MIYLAGQMNRMVDGTVGEVEQYYSPITATHKLDSHPKSSRVLRPSYVINLFFAPCRAHAVAVRHIQRSLEHSVWCMV